MRRNPEITHGLVFSQIMLLTLINKGVNREQAYRLVQNNAMKAWQEKENFLSLLETDEKILTHLSKSELASLFDYNYYPGCAEYDSIYRYGAKPSAYWFYD